MRAIPKRPHLPRADRRRAEARDGLPLLEPPLPLLSRARASCRSTPSWTRCRRPASTGCSRSRSSTTASAPARRAASPIDGQRSLIFMLDELRRRTGAAVAGPAGAAAARGVRRRRVRRIRDGRDRAPRISRSCSPGSASRKAGQHRSKAVDPLAPGRHQHRRERATRKASPIPSTSRTAPPSARWRCGSTTRRRRSSARVQLLDQPFRQAVGPGELDIPAVRGLGGSLLYFVDRTERARPASGMSTSSRSRADRRRAMPASTAFDHISQSMHYEEMLTWLLFYTSLLDVAKDAGAGRHRSRRRRAEPGRRRPTTARLRLVLNASQSRRTLSSRFLNELFGSGVQHIALATDDIFATVERAARRTASTSCRSRKTTTTISRPAPTSSPEEIARLRESDILYDRDGAAEYFQVYTQHPRRRLLLRDRRAPRNYAGFGAVNAPIRLAAADAARAASGNAASLSRTSWSETARPCSSTSDILKGLGHETRRHRRRHHRLGAAQEGQPGGADHDRRADRVRPTRRSRREPRSCTSMSATTTRRRPPIPERFARSRRASGSIAPA